MLIYLENVNFIQCLGCVQYIQITFCTQIIQFYANHIQMTPIMLSHRIIQLIVIRIAISDIRSASRLSAPESSSPLHQQMISTFRNRITIEAI